MGPVVARPAHVPSHPDRIYKHEGWHWLGTGTVGPKYRKFLPLKKALVYARSLKLKNMKYWQQWCKSGARQANMPSDPDNSYKHDGWQGYGHWLGTGNVGVKKDQQFLPFKKALLYARALKLKNTKEWVVWRRTVPPPRTKSTGTMGGKGTDTGWAPAQLLTKTSSSRRSRRR